MNRHRPRRLVVSAMVAVGSMLVVSAPVAGLPGQADPEPISVDGVVQPERLSTPVFSARRIPHLLQSGQAAAALRTVADEVVAPAPDTSCLVVSDGGRVVYSHNPLLSLAPASNQKLPVSLSAVEILGADHRPVTEIRAASGPVEGVVDGDLWVVGGGDALASTPGFRVVLTEPDQRVVSEYAEVADAIVAAGITEIVGDVVGDDSRYDDERYVASWPQRYQRQDTVGPLGALRVNEASTGLVDRPDEPAVERQPGDPALLAAATLITLLTERGVDVGGQAATGVAPPSSELLTDVAGPDLPAVLDEVVGWSRNAAAELLVKEIDVASGGRGTTAGGLGEVRRRMEAHGLAMDGVTMVDGSGLDEQNRSTCTFLVELLDIFEPDSPVVQSLSVSGERGTLTRRMVDTPAQGRIRAKTGTLNLVLSLAGYADTVEGRTLTFAFIVNIPPEGAPEATTLQQDRLAEALVAYPRAASLDELVPR